MENMDLYNLIAFCVLFTIVTVFVYLTWNYNYWCLKNIVQAPSITVVFGNIMCIFELNENMASLCKKLHDKFKGKSMYGFYYMRTPALLLREPELAKRLLQTKSSCFKSFICPNSNCDPLLAKSPLFTADNSWMLKINTAKKIIDVFDSNIFRRIRTDFNAYVDETIRNNRNGVTEIDLTDAMGKFAGEIVAAIGFGVGHKNSVTTPDASVISSAMKTIFQPGGYKQTICLFAPWIAGLLRLKLVSNETDKLFRQTVKNVLKNQSKTQGFKKNGPKHQDYLHWLAQQAADKNEMDEDKLAAQLFAFCLEIYIYSSIIANFTAFYLAWNPDVQEKVRREFSKATEDTDGEYLSGACSEFIYLEQVINESMRLNPALGFICKQVIETVDFTGSDGQNCCLKPGDLVFVSNLGIHSDQEIWPDPQTFDPSRFDNIQINKRKFSYLPHEGDKYCVSQTFNMIMVKMMLTTLLKKYRLRPSGKTKMPPKMSTRTQFNIPEKGLWVQLENVEK